MRLRILYVLAVLAAIIRADLEDAIYDLLLDLEQEVSGDPPCSCVINAGEEPYEAFCIKACHDKSECDKFTVYCKWEGATVLPLEKSSAKLEKKCPFASTGCGQDKHDHKLGILPHSYCKEKGQCCSKHGGCDAKICGTQMHVPFYDYKGCMHHALKPNHKELTPPKCPFASEGCGKDKMDSLTHTLFPESFCQAKGHCCNEWGGCGTKNCKDTCAYGPCGSEEWRRYDSGGCIRGTKHGYTKPNASAQLQKCPWATSGCGIDKENLGTTTLPKSYCQNEGDCCNKWGGCSEENCETEDEFRNFDHLACFSTKKYIAKPKHKPLKPKKKPRMRGESCGCVLKEGYHEDYAAYCNPHCASEVSCTTEPAKSFCDWKGESPGPAPSSPTPKPTSPLNGCDCVANSGSEAYVSYCNKHCDKEAMCDSVGVYCHWVGTHTYHPPCPSNGIVRCDKQCGPAVNGPNGPTIGGKFYCGEPGECCNTSGQCSKDEGICKNMPGFNGDFDYGICPQATSEDCKKPDDGHHPACPSNPLVRCDKQCGPVANGPYGPTIEGNFYCGEPGECCNTSGQCSKDEGICKNMPGFNGDYDYKTCHATYPADCNKPNNGGNDNGCECVARSGMEASAAFCNNQCHNHDGCRKEQPARSYCKWNGGSSRSAHRSRSAAKDKIPVLLKLLKAIDNEAENFHDLLYGTDMDELKDRLFN